MSARRTALAGGAGLLALVLVVALVLARRSTDAVASSVRDLRRNGDFASSRQAGVVLARISERLLDDGRRCSAAHAARTTGAVRCDRRLAVAGWSSIAALATVSCTQPGTQQIRRDLLAHLEAVQAADRGRGDPRPALPGLPTC